MTATPSVPPISRIVSLTADAAPVELSGTVLIRASVAGPWIRAMLAAIRAMVGTTTNQ